VGGVVALMAAFWVFTLQVIAGVTGLGPRSPVRPAGRPQTPRRRTRARIPATTRMAVQMGVAVAIAFTSWRLIWPSHWTWTVLTAFIVCSGARSRGDVIHNGLLRTLGAGAGTILGTLIASTFPPFDQTSIVVIFAVLALATWLRALSYAYWAASVTTMLSLLYGYFGASATSLLHTRLEAILLGALIGVAASWIVLPISTDVLRSRLAMLLAALSDLLTRGPRETTTLTRLQAHFDHSVHQFEQIAAPFEAHRRLTRHRHTTSANADAVAAVRQSVVAVHALIRCATNDTDVLVSPRVVRAQSAIAANIGALRRQIAGVPGAGYRPLPRTAVDWATTETRRSFRSSPTSTAHSKSSRETFRLPPPLHQPGRSRPISGPLAFSTNGPTAGCPHERPAPRSADART
jgi:uncharacterized membrane protein YccC